MTYRYAIHTYHDGKLVGTISGPGGMQRKTAEAHLEHSLDEVLGRGYLNERDWRRILPAIASHESAHGIVAFLATDAGSIRVTQGFEIRHH